MPSYYTPTETARRPDVDTRLRAAILDAVGEAVMAADRDGRIIYWNAAAESLYGWTPEEAIGAELVALIPAEGSRADAVAIIRHLRAGKSWSGEFFVRHRNGGWFPIHATTTPVLDEDGRVLAMVGVSRDLTAQRDTEEILRQTEERLELVHRTAESVIWEWDLQTRTLRWSGALADSFGYDPESVDASVTWWEERLHPEDRSRVENSLTAALTEGRRFWTEEYRFRRSDGTYAVIFDRAYVAVDGGGRPVRMVGSMLDMTERRRTHEAVRFLAQASMLLDLSLDYETTLPALARLAAQTVADVCILAIGTRAGLEQLVGAASDPAIQEPLDRLLALLTAAGIQGTLVERVLESGESVILPELSPTLLDDRQVDADLREAALGLDVSGVVIAPITARAQVVGALVLARTATSPRPGDEDVRIAEELGRRIGLAVDNARLFHSAQQARRAKSDFLSVVSHELRTPLTAVMGYADLLAAQIAGGLNEKQQHQVGRVRAGADKLLQVIEAILTYARLETGRETAQLERVPLSKILDRVRHIAAAQAAERHITLEEDLDAAPETICVDVEKITQILLALVTNAVKFTSEGGRCGIRVAGEEDRLVFDIWDTGSGISEEHIPHLFSPFWQAEQPEIRRSGGPGLGLSLARRLARVMGGDVRVLDTSPLGTTLRVDLPIRD